MMKLTFSTDELPADMDDEARFRLWLELHASNMAGSMDAARNPDIPFSADYRIGFFGDAIVARFEGGLSAISRNARQIAAEPLDGFALSFSTVPGARSVEQRGRELTLRQDSAFFFSSSEPHAHRAANGDGWAGVFVPRGRLIERIPEADDLVLMPFDPENEAIKHLRGYVKFLLESAAADAPALVTHIETTLIDLMVLALGTGRDAAQMARMRGLRSVRLHEALSTIRQRYADPAFSSEAAARALGISRRYLNRMLHETGSSFAERVLELRLQKARTTLADPRNDRLKINEIALACGFNEVSYFHRCFRRRFGDSPAQYRGGNGAA